MSARVLIVDDEEFIRCQLRHALEQLGYEVVAEASSGAEALLLYGEFGPDLVTMDVTMPDQGGIETTRQLLESDPAARVIMISALIDRQRMLESMQAGAKDYVLKPIDFQRLREVMHSALEVSV